jgi:hypothetical protein
VKVPAELAALLDAIVVVKDSTRVEDLSQKFLMVSSEVLGDEYFADGHAVVWQRSTVAFDEAERMLEGLDEDLALELWEAAKQGTLTR